MVFKNPINGYMEASNTMWLWCLLFGVFYFAYKGIWIHVFIGFLAGLITGGLSWFVYVTLTKTPFITPEVELLKLNVPIKLYPVPL